MFNTVAKAISGAFYVFVNSAPRPPLPANFDSGWTFEHDWEVVPGEWKFEVQKDGKTLAEKSFQVK